MLRTSNPIQGPSIRLNTGAGTIVESISFILLVKNRKFMNFNAKQIYSMDFCIKDKAYFNC